jgi:PAS domain S-box-containing protein
LIQALSGPPAAPIRGMLAQMATVEKPSTAGELDPLDRRIETLAWAFGSSPDLVFAAGADGRVLFANAAARRRWPDMERGSGPAASFFDGVAEGFGALEATVLRAGQPALMHWGDEGPAGTRSWFGCTLSPLTVGDAVTGYLCLSSDVTELKRSEDRLRRNEQLMVDTQGVAHLGTWEWDVNQPTATWSPELYRIYGLSPEAYVPSYEQYLKLVHPDDRQRVMDATNRVFQQNVPYSHDERIFRPDGTMRYLHTWAHPVRDEGGRLVRLVGVCQDITDRKEAEEEVRKLNAELEARVADRTRTIENSLRDLEAFNAMASHDLRAPLSVIQNSCAVIDKVGAEALPPRVGQNLARIQRSVVQMTSLVNDLLKLSHVGNAPLTRGEVDLSALSNEVVADLRRASPARQVEVDVAPGLRCVGDPALMRAAIENLLGNAWKYSSRVEHARIEVGAAESDGRRAFYVSDNGAGFDMKDSHRLFAPFQRLHDAADFEGTGIGLAAVHRIIERHDGRIWAESEPGRGAKFFFDLPLPATSSRPR